MVYTKAGAILEGGMRWQARRVLNKKRPMIVGRSLNYYDDPTHFGRPHSPQSLYRLFRMFDGEVLKCDYIAQKSLRWKFPYLISKALITRNGAMLEEVIWKTLGFAVFGIARKQAEAERKYVLSA